MTNDAHVLPEDGEPKQSLGELAHQLAIEATEAANNDRLDDSIKLFNRVLDILKQLPDNDDHKDARAFFLNKLAYVEHANGATESAIKHLNDAIALCNQLPQTIINIYSKESYMEHLEDIEYELSDDSLLDSLKNKSKYNHKGKHISEKDIAANYHFTNKKPGSSTDYEQSGLPTGVIPLAILILAIILLVSFC
ncbi:MAG: hypothetical protein K6F33_08120 [Bacteroidales bacterium]|nr:hypothetical protein [Bacteroidales bacterium]